ncbi:MAG: hypothetical protein ACI86X_001066 [Moritella sp.]|jgi:hypothetical protein
MTKRRLSGFNQSIIYGASIALMKGVSLLMMGWFTAKTIATGIPSEPSVYKVRRVLSLLLLTPYFQVWGIILSLLLAQSIRLLFFYNASQRFQPLRYPFASLIMLTSLCIFWLLLGSWFPTIGPSILITLMATASIPAAAHWLKLITLPINSLKKVAKQ